MISDHTRAPCPQRIIEDFGGAFAMGTVGSTLFHFPKGFINSPRGTRLWGALTAVKLKAPVTGGGFAAWGGLYSLFDCSFVYMRKKEDPYNGIMSGALAGGVLSCRSGLTNMIFAFIFGGTIIAVIEGVGVLLSRSQAALYHPVAPKLPA